MRLEPLDAASYGDDLFEVATVPDAADRFRYLSEEPPKRLVAFQTWLKKAQASEDPLYFSVIDKASGKSAGRQTFMRIEPAHGRIEIGHIHWGPAIARKPAGYRGALSVHAARLRGPRLPPLGLIFLQLQRAVEARSRAVWFEIRGRFSSAHDSQGRELRHSLGFHDHH